MRKTAEIPNSIHAAVDSVAKQIRSRYRDYVEYEDVAQELYIWYLKHTRKVAEWEAQYHPKSVQRLIAKSMRNAGEKYARAEKAQRFGLEPEDEFFYSIPMIADMLQLYFDPDWREPKGISYDNVQTADAGGGPSDGMNLVSMVADVGKAYEALSASDQELLRYVYAGDPRAAITVLALEWEITPNAADHRVRRVVGRIRAALGGPKPFEEAPDE